MVGARMVLPGPFLDGENIYALMDTYRVTISTGGRYISQAARCMGLLQAWKCSSSKQRPAAASLNGWGHPHCTSSRCDTAT